jgi:putative transposase
MAATYINLTTHIVFATKNRLPLIADPWRAGLHASIGGTLKGLGGFPFAVGGVSDHVHLVADLVRELKKTTSAWAAERCPEFRWQTGYAAISVSPHVTPEIVRYIKGQEDHHRQVSSVDELRRLLKEAGIPIVDAYFE